jgi:hypothetical protein
MGRRLHRRRRHVQWSFGGFSDIDPECRVREDAGMALEISESEWLMMRGRGRGDSPNGGTVPELVPKPDTKTSLYSNVDRNHAAHCFPLATNGEPRSPGERERPRHTARNEAQEKKQA